MAMWCKGLQMTASSLTAARVRIPAGTGENVASDLGLGGGFRRVLQFPLPFTSSQSRLSCNMAEKVTKIKNLKSFVLQFAVKKQTNRFEPHPFTLPG